MSYCTLEEAFQTNIAESVLPPMRQQSPEEPSSRSSSGKLKSRKHRRSNLPPQEPSVIEPDRPAHRPKQPAELLGGSPPKNDLSTSLSSYLIGAPDPNEDFFPYPSDESPDYDKQFMLEPNWYEQFQEHMPNPKAETPKLPGASVDGYSTLYKKVPFPKIKYDEERNLILPEEKSVSLAGTVTNDPDLRKRLDELFQKIDNLEISRSESNHSEIILFVMTGIFVLLMLDLLLKQGSRALNTITTAAAIPHIVRGGAAYNNPFFF